MVCRYDAVGTVEKHSITPQGYLLAPAYLTRPGVFEYRRADGSVSRELKPPEEIFSAATLASLALLPLTDEHPVTGRLDSVNTKFAQIGHLGENAVREGNLVAGRVLITDADAVKKVLSGEKTQLSVGHTAEVHEEPGIYNGQPYDRVQRNIRGNHVALTAAARLGPEMRVKLDSADAVMVGDQSTAVEPKQSKQSSEQSKMIKYRIDGVEVEVSETAVQLIEKQSAGFKSKIAEQGEQLEATKKDLAKQSARADSAVEAQTKAETALKAAQDPTALRERIHSRVTLEKQAGDILGDKVKLDSMDDLQIKAAVIEKLSPGFKAEGKGADYVSARYDLAVEAASKDALGNARRAVDPTPDRNDSRDPVSAADARKNMLKETGELWKSPLSTHKQ